VVFVGGSGSEDRLAAALRLLARARVGVSPVYSDLRATVDALRRARVVMAGMPAGLPAVRRYGDDPVSVVVASAGGGVLRLEDSVLAPVLGLDDAERRSLLVTLDAWYASGGSAAATGERLSFHANTVRHRLRRIESAIGRSLSDPRTVAEVYVALEVWHQSQP